ncbi:MAG: sulfide/dihydroorotate dehydrogenase-like FAD/NAD-binding protein [Candidatus Omnitrophica bacterium]|nr:sulfide/dihydroorotate dehydrogenase-like FAD/NAD-binding protein [Candidatus Omnitrophota bacterium]MCF7892333.1 sulfide/dihydroorotate dehydrogenase-like FAD/NAD-binding protein [Candidatus Omnitrophota bacterium]MCF7897854.1 sulfide/dihydroorotate dehydrogenase-like FAD/NAD-binding protein [Candidatus Omnitrophota bacterium]MCF7909142.1 sulfide/dihydroorotate dehydrogenase-like FAD/NAD-binding protein [Candidatus Omnitrophota bacterium]
MKIINKKILAKNQTTKIVQFKVGSEAIAKKAKAGQFVVVMATEKSERIPLTLVDNNPQEGTITLIVQEAGFSTKQLATLKEGDSLYSVTGPLGHPTEIKNYGKIILVGGGVGIAEIYPVAKTLKKVGNDITTIIGAKTKDLLILEPELKQISNLFYISTDDGTAGKKGFVTDLLEEVISENSYDLVYTVGPLLMMREVAKKTKEKKVKTLVSLAVLMVDATGMCGCCRVSVGSETKFACVDGPEFDAHSIDWKEVLRRNSMYTKKEKHICRLSNHEK